MNIKEESLHSNTFVSRYLNLKNSISEKKKVIGFLNDELDELKMALVRYSSRHLEDITPLRPGARIVIGDDASSHVFTVQEILLADVCCEEDSSMEIYVSVRLTDDRVVNLPAEPLNGSWIFNK
jgi:hypothetical protein